MLALVPMTTVKDRYYIYLSNKAVGIIEYIAQDNIVEIVYIKIHKEVRRTGLATEVVNALLDKYDYIIGDSLLEAKKFWENCGAVFQNSFNNNGTILIPFSICKGD